jgi:hypothetical protein
MVWTYENTLGPKLTHDYKRNWQAIWYLRGPQAPPLQSPILTEQFAVHAMKAPDGRLGDRYHTWQKPEDLATRFIKHSTTQGGDVAASWNLLKCTGLFGAGVMNGVHGAHIEHELRQHATNQARIEQDRLHEDSSMTGALERLDFNVAARTDEILAELLDQYTDGDAEDDA